MNALVTGGCKGLGKIFTLELLNRGYKVYALYNKSVDAALELENSFDNVRCIKCDIKNEAEVERILFNINDIDIIINNAAIAIDSEYKDKTKKEFMRVLETNVVGTFLVTKYALQSMSKNGVIVNISSNAAINANTIYSMDYDASKAGVNMLTKDFALVIDNEKNCEKIISICPGWINTEEVMQMNPNYLEEELKRTKQNKLLDKEELVKYILYNLDTYKNGDIIEIKNIG
ncbi:MAG: SDR family oxidoreductase [Erysipelotrichales bacterium]|nr:SDR family oxidoreductase [Erysipelotrichales bacterium]